MGKFNIRTVFAYDWPLALAGVEHIAGDACAIELVGAYRSPSDMVAALADVDCDIALVDYSIRGGPPMDCLALLAWLRRMRPGVGTVALVGSESPVILRSIVAQGCPSLVSKFDDVGHIVTAIHSTYSGGRYVSPLVRSALDAIAEQDGPPVKLSTREIEVIRLYLDGMPIKTIAQRLNKGKQTVSAQKISAMKKLGVNNDVELIQRAAALGFGGGQAAGRLRGAGAVSVMQRE
ncbi:response regulator transcription factor [Burkholderia vietnamiensis]|uniref:response regulator transcription factor n=1 Tax=Burkholderia vietnamiensis TaxID=60552 RepID=UPI00158D41EF|nr:response regulator transcription factor [Burkholderia vietnamiensis]MBR8031294.1 response regulator transcription factor [Burkholderia vietnamiensis]MDN7816674.1 response regulator transcription factor [Burkholderia vietnamiensis]HDR9085256.1 response regulator transcription factor [Burkholderia vietnamiensis]